ncbi:hypothetical protein [Ruegeria arenilitoris]|uniref:hypothetical protein n=1 Tax=Ruegeria arenilitoris TaxID=1173585 RepID=UPI00147FB2EC|nr:hypothetical protein [Ruegeria arenilitoris]
MLAVIRELGLLGRFSNTMARRIGGWLVLLWFSLLGFGAAAQEVTVYIFWQEGCPYCSRATEAIKEMTVTDSQLSLKRIELSTSDEDDDLFRKTVIELGIENPAVPLVVVGSQHQTGFAAGRSEAVYLDMIETCRASHCFDLIGSLKAANETGHTVGAATEWATDAGTLYLPLFGKVSLSDLSLPVLTLALGALDGFNPCAMWVLALLIGLLLGIKDTARMWTLGFVFLGTTGLMYFALLATWLNVVLWIGVVTWLRLSVGVVALAAGLFYLREYWTNPEGVCKVTKVDRKQSVAASFRGIVEEPSLLLASLSIAVLAVSVNLIELIC